jgi:4-hydroxybenzoate polyprenyltransferase
MQNFTSDKKLQAMALQPHDSLRDGLVSEEQRFPICVDLDDTLVKTDILWESLFALLKINLAYIFLVPFWLLRGKAYLKQEITRRVTLDVTCLPYNSELLSFLIKVRQLGCQLALVTASNVKIAQQIADHLGIFTDILASDDKTNLSGAHKLRALIKKYGPRGYDYAGNASVDLKIWTQARQAIVVGASSSFVQRVQRITTVGHVFKARSISIRLLLRTIRVHQWAKNSLIFVPLITSHQASNGYVFLASLYAFVAFSLCASSLYVLNDCLDLEADRQHPQKRCRSFAAGDLPVSLSFALVPALFCGGLFVASLLPEFFRTILLAYSGLALSYSLYFKKFVLVDVLMLALLYTIRMYAGAVAIGVTLSHWLLIFSMFLFLSLALMKRFTEIRTIALRDQKVTRGRGYWAEDLEHIASVGAASGYISVLVLALYVNSNEVHALYSRPEILWLQCPLMLYWISLAWLLAYRGQMQEDPVVFALRDIKSYVVGLMIGIIMVMAA